MNAPRILREMDGDFEVRVKVHWDGPPSEVPAHGGSLSFHGAGLLLWSGDRSTLIRLERAAFVRGGGLNRYLLFERLSRAMPQAEQDIPLGEGPVWLRLARVGDSVTAAFSIDGSAWQNLPQLAFPRGKCGVGIAAVNTSAKPLNASYSEYRSSRTEAASGQRRRSAMPAPGRRPQASEGALTTNVLSIIFRKSEISPLCRASSWSPCMIA